MSSNLKVNTILPSSGTTVAVSGIASVTSSVSIASSCTATTFYGSGANLTALNLVTDSSPQLGGNLDCNNKNISLNDSTGGTNNRIKIGTHDDLQLWHNSSTGNSNISNYNGNLYLQGNNGSGTAVNQIAILSNSSVELNYQGSKRFETSSAGVKLLGSGTDAIEMTGDVWFNNNEHAGADIYFNSGDKRLIYEDNVKAVFGGGGDIEIIHDGNSKITNTNNSCDLRIASDSVEIKANSVDELMMKGTVNSDVKLYWNGAAKLYTNANGVNVDKCLQAGSVQTPIESSITFHQSHDPAGLFYPEGSYGNNNSPNNERQAFIIGSTKGNWQQGNGSASHRSVGIKFSRITNSTEYIRAGIQHDISGTEKFKLWTSYGDIHFKTRNGNNGNQTWEECDRDPLVMHHNGHVSMCHMPRTIWQVQQSSSSYSGNTTEYQYTGGSATDSNGMVTNTSNGTITVPYTGMYQINMNIGLHSNSATNQRLNLKVNGSNYQRTESTETGWCTHTITHCILLAANDVLTFTCVGRTDGGDYAKMSVVMMHGTATT
tara:strand:- start:338 stop:1972 length:1635 start_codon:yes stop_codon:yes gene_type:complete